MKNIVDIYLDFDGVIVNTCKAGVKYLNKTLNNNVDWRTVKKYDFSDKFDLKNIDIREIFKSSYFWDNLELFPNVYNTVQYLSEKYNIIIFSIGTYMNIQNKLNYIYNTFSNNLNIKTLMYCDEFHEFSKLDFLNLNYNSLYIDDKTSNLDKSNSKHNILFKPYGIETEWNMNDTYIEISHFDELLNFLNRS